MKAERKITLAERERLVRNFGPRILGEIRHGLVTVEVVLLPHLSDEDMTIAWITGEVNGKLLEEPTLFCLV